MGWFENLWQTYDRVSDIAGIPDKNGNTLWPLYHMAAQSMVCVTIDGNGKFRHAEKEQLRIVIPYTEDSASRSGKGIMPHPLHDQLEYLALNEAKREAYLDQLAAWSGAHPKVQAVYRYVAGKTLPHDLQESDLKAPKAWLIRFRVEISDDCLADLWKDKEVFQAWIHYYQKQQGKERKLCYVSGVEAVPLQKHLKGVNPKANGAKLISCNDETNYTYRGRFHAPEEANSISAEVSHKAHAMLNYLLSTQGSICGSQGVAAWTIDDGSAQPDPFKSSSEIYKNTRKTDSEKMRESKEGQLGYHYAKELRKAIYSKGNPRSLTNTNRQTAVIAVDAATTGRMAVTFYQNLLENEYLERILAWHESCCWWFQDEKLACISAPDVDKIITAVYGEEKGKESEAYTKIKKAARERLLHHIVNGQPLGREWVAAATARVSNPFSYSKKDGGWDQNKWENAVYTACALARKYYNRTTEVFGLELDQKCTDRDYLFGRLLAIADKIESHARYLQTKGSDTEKRPTNAVRYMQAFASRPVRTWKLLFEQINPYIQRLDGADGYQQQIDEIMSLFEAEGYSDKPLEGKYLLGYSLQRMKYKTGKEKAVSKNDQQQTG